MGETNCVPVIAEARSERLARLVTKFRVEGYDGAGYPSEDDREHKRVRAEFQEILNSLPSLRHDNCEVVKKVWSNIKHNYGNVGPAATHADRLIKRASESEAEWTRIREHLCDLCFGTNATATRIDAIQHLKGLKVLIPTKLLAVCHPDDIIPNFVVVSERETFPGKLDAIRCLRNLALLDECAESEAAEIELARVEHGDCGAVIVRTNNLLRETLRRDFIAEGEVDTWGMSQFVYWLMRRFSLDKVI